MRHEPNALATTIDPMTRIGIVRSMFYKEEIDQLALGARKVFLDAGIQESSIREFPAYGSFEIPLIGAKLAAEQSVDALIGLGIIVQGETHHADLLAAETARGMMQVQIQYHIPFGFEVLYVDQLSQAQERSVGLHNKGAEAARSVLLSLSTLNQIAASK